MSAPIRNFINGELVDARADSGFDVIDPATEEVYAVSPVSGQADVDAAFAASNGGPKCRCLPKSQKDMACETA